MSLKSIPTYPFRISKPIKYVNKKNKQIKCKYIWIKIKCFLHGQVALEIILKINKKK
jgi:hypothetical protein